MFTKKQKKGGNWKQTGERRKLALKFAIDDTVMVETKTKSQFRLESLKKFRKDGAKDCEVIVWVELKIRGLFKNLYKGQMNFQNLSLIHNSGITSLQPPPGSNWVLYFLQKLKQKAVLSETAETAEDEDVASYWK